MLTDYYAILEVPSNATLAEIKRSYRRLARQYHPDLNPATHNTRDVERIKMLNEAYRTLNNPTKRASYDAQYMEERRRIAVQEARRRQLAAQQEARRREREMSWGAGLIGFVKELKKGLQDE